MLEKRISRRGAIKVAVGAGLGLGLVSVVAPRVPVAHAEPMTPFTSSQEIKDFGLEPAYNTRLIASGNEALLGIVGSKRNSNADRSLGVAMFDTEGQLSVHNLGTLDVGVREMVVDPKRVDNRIMLEQIGNNREDAILRALIQWDGSVSAVQAQTTATYLWIHRTLLSEDNRYAFVPFEDGPKGDARIAAIDIQNPGMDVLNLFEYPVSIYIQPETSPRRRADNKYVAYGSYNPEANSGYSLYDDEEQRRINTIFMDPVNRTIDREWISLPEGHIVNRVVRAFEDSEGAVRFWVVGQHQTHDEFATHLYEVDANGQILNDIAPKTVAKPADGGYTQPGYKHPRIGSVVNTSDTEGLMVVAYPLGSGYSSANIERFSFVDPSKATILPKDGEWPTLQLNDGSTSPSEGPLGDLNLIGSPNGDTYVTTSLVLPAAGPKEGFLYRRINGDSSADTWKAAILK